MPMGYDPNEKADGVGGRAEPGEYHFRVEDATEKLFRSGNEGCELKISVSVSRDREIQVRDWFTYAPNALWKLEQFFKSVHLDFRRPPEVYQLVGCAGRARFKRDKNGYLAVAEYLTEKIPQQQQPRGPHATGGVHHERPPATPPQRYGALGDDDVPF